MLAVALDLGGTFLKTALINNKGEILARGMEPTGPTPKAVIKQMVDATEEYKSHPAAKNKKIAAIGIGAPGPLDINTGVVIVAPNLPTWKNVHLTEPLTKATGLPAFLDNDANLAALGESWLGAGREVDSMILITLGTGVGGGLILNNEIWHGIDSTGGEIGHMIVVPNGLQCACGSKGCLEAYASATAIVKRTKAHIKEGRKTGLVKMVDGKLNRLTSKLVYEASQKGDRLAIKVMKETGEYLGYALASLINLLNPEIIALGGGVVNGATDILKEARAVGKFNAFKTPAKRVRIIKAKMGGDAGVYGAAKLAFTKSKTRTV
jgi:glucokinase